VHFPQTRGPVDEPVVQPLGSQFVACLMGLPVGSATPTMDAAPMMGGHGRIGMLLAALGGLDQRNGGSCFVEGPVVLQRSERGL